MQHKTRCDYTSATGEELLRCKRCTHFNTSCSFQQQAPPATSHIFPTPSPMVTRQQPDIVPEVTSQPISASPSSLDIQAPKASCNVTSSADLPRIGKVLDYLVSPLSTPRSVETAGGLKRSMELVQVDTVRLSREGRKTESEVR